MKHPLFLSLGSALLVVLPTLALLPGCGGGNSNVAVPTPTSAATPTGTTAATPVMTGATPGTTVTARPTATNTTVPATTAPVATPTRLPTATPSATPRINPTTIPTTTPTSTGNNRLVNLAFSSVSNTNCITTPLSATLASNSSFSNGGTAGFNGSALFTSKTGSITRKLTFSLRGASAINTGEAITLGATNLVYSEIGATNIERAWAAQSGTYFVTSANAKQVAFKLQNVRFAPTSNTGAATGTFALNGSGSVGQ